MKKGFIVGAMGIFALLFFTIGCSTEPLVFPEALSEEKAASIATTYFRTCHGIDVCLERVDYDRVSENCYQQCIVVRDLDKNTYELRLDEKNLPVADNYQCLIQLEKAKKSVDIDRSCEFSAEYSHEAEGYLTVAAIELDGLPLEEDEQKLYAQMQLLGNSGIRKLVFLVMTPDFLLPQTGKLQLGTCSFSTDLSEKNFNDKYTVWAKSFFWDRDAFRDVEKEMEQLGGRNVHVYLENKYVNGGLSLVLYYESDNPFSQRQEESLVQSLNNNAFRIRGLNVFVRLEQGSNH